MNDSLKAQCIAEFMGTGLFIFFGASCLSAVKLAGASFGLWEICIVWGLGIALAVYLTAAISGAHLNPAVTIALWLFACFDGKKSGSLHYLTGSRGVWWCLGMLRALLQFVHRL